MNIWPSEGALAKVLSEFFCFPKVFSAFGLGLRLELELGGSGWGQAGDGVGAGRLFGAVGCQAAAGVLWDIQNDTTTLDEFA